jgi:hypothetical protein
MDVTVSGKVCSVARHCILDCNAIVDLKCFPQFLEQVFGYGNKMIEYYLSEGNSGISFH